MLVYIVRQEKLYAAETYSLNLSDTTSDVVIGIIPEGVTGDYTFGLMMAVEKKACLSDSPLIGHSMDSASNSLRALLKNASPATFEKLTSPVKYLCLPLDDFVYVHGTSITSRLSKYFIPLLGPFRKDIRMEFDETKHSNS